MNSKEKEIILELLNLAKVAEYSLQNTHESSNGTMVMQSIDVGNIEIMLCRLGGLVKSDVAPGGKISMTRVDRAHWALRGVLGWAGERMEGGWLDIDAQEFEILARGLLHMMLNDKSMHDVGCRLLSKLKALSINQKGEFKL